MSASSERTLDASTTKTLKLTFSNDTRSRLVFLTDVFRGRRADWRRVLSTSGQRRSDRSCRGGDTRASRLNLEVSAIERAAVEHQRGLCGGFLGERDLGGGWRGLGQAGDGAAKGEKRGEFVFRGGGCDARDLSERWSGSG